MIAANAGGDARVAIGTLRRAARNASAGRITAEMIREVVPEAKSEIQQKTVDRLTADQEILYGIVSDCGEIDPQRLYEAYCEQVRSSSSSRSACSIQEANCGFIFAGQLQTGSGSALIRPCLDA